MQSLKEINSIITKELANPVAKIFEQIGDQNAVNKFLLQKLNEKALIFSNGKKPFQITDENEAILGAIFAYLNRNSDESTRTYEDKDGKHVLNLDKGICLLGNFGIGKTLLMTVIWENKERFKISGKWSTSRQIHECKKEDQYLIVGTPKYGLFIDDLGDEPKKRMDFGNEDTPVANVLKERLDAWERLPETPKLFITSNCSPAVLKDIYGGRIESRIYSACNVIISRQKTDFRKL